MTPMSPMSSRTRNTRPLAAVPIIPNRIVVLLTRILHHLILSTRVPFPMAMSVLSKWRWSHRSRPITHLWSSIGAYTSASVSFTETTGQQACETTRPARTGMCSRWSSSRRLPASNTLAASGVAAVVECSGLLLCSVRAACTGVVHAFWGSVYPGAVAAVWGAAGVDW